MPDFFVYFLASIKKTGSQDFEVGFVIKQLHLVLLEASYDDFDRGRGSFLVQNCP